MAGRLGGAAGERRFAGARLAEAIRRKTLSILRGEIRPVPASVRRAFVARRQGAVAGARFAGRDAAERAVGLLRGLALPAAAWEASVLPARLAEPEPDALDVLSARGLLVWRLDGEKELRSSRMSLFFRGEGRFVLPDDAAAARGALSGGPRSPRGARPRRRVVPLRPRRTARPAAPRRSWRRSASSSSPGSSPGTASTASGSCSARSEPRPRPPAAAAASFGRRPVAPLAAGRGGARRLAPRFRVPRRPPPPRTSSRAAGRSSRRRRSSGPSSAPGERAEAWARLLLARWGVVSRAVVEAAESAVRWSDVAPALARMELRGDVRRGEFVEGDGPLQYAEPEVVEELRRMREAGTRASPADGLAALAGSDPVLLGLDAPRDGYCVLRHGAPVLIALGFGGARPRRDARVRPRPAAPAFAELQALLRRGARPARPAAPARRRRRSRPPASSRPAAGSPLAPLFEGLGFTRDGTPTPGGRCSRSGTGGPEGPPARSNAAPRSCHRGVRGVQGTPPREPHPPESARYSASFGAASKRAATTDQSIALKKASM